MILALLTNPRKFAFFEIAIRRSAAHSLSRLPNIYQNDCGNVYVSQLYASDSTGQMLLEAVSPQLSDSVHVSYGNRKLQ